MQEAQRGIPYSPLTVAKFDEAVALLAEALQLMSLLIGVHTKLFPDDQKIFEVESMVESSELRRVPSNGTTDHPGIKICCQQFRHANLFNSQP